MTRQADESLKEVLKEQAETDKLFYDTYGCTYDEYQQEHLRTW